MFDPIIPDYHDLGKIKDLAQDVIDASARLEGRVALETAQALGDQLRLVNSYFSNLIEGHKTTIPEIENTLTKAKFSDDDERQYAQKLCAAHVLAEKELMDHIAENPSLNVASPDFLRMIHSTIYSHLPEKHLFTHDENGFTNYPVLPGELRDLPVSVGIYEDPIGPEPKLIGDYLQAFSEAYDPAYFHGDERLIAMAASHHRLTWIHPFRDGNGRVSRLFSGLFMSRVKINRANLWSLSRGFSRNKNEYMVNLFSVDPAPRKITEGMASSSELLADFCAFFFELCLDQISFMEKLLRFDEIEARIEWFVEKQSQGSDSVMKPKAARLLRALFMRGSIERGEAPAILNSSESGYRRILKQLMQEGLVVSQSHRAPLQVGLPTKVLPFYFPDLYEPAILDQRLQ